MTCPRCDATAADIHKAQYSVGNSTLDAVRFKRGSTEGGLYCTQCQTHLPTCPFYTNITFDYDWEAHLNNDADVGAKIDETLVRQKSVGITSSLAAVTVGTYLL